MCSMKPNVHIRHIHTKQKSESTSNLRIDEKRSHNQHDASNCSMTLSFDVINVRIPATTNHVCTSMHVAQSSCDHTDRKHCTETSAERNASCTNTANYESRKIPQRKSINHEFPSKDHRKTTTTTQESEHVAYLIGKRTGNVQ